MRFENPHSLSYHANTFTSRSPEAIVSKESKTAECGFPTTSCDTIGSSVYWRIPRRSPSAASFIAAFTEAADVGFEVTAVSFLTEPAAHEHDRPSPLPV